MANEYELENNFKINVVYLIVEHCCNYTCTATNIKQLILINKTNLKQISFHVIVFMFKEKLQANHFVNEILFSGWNEYINVAILQRWPNLNIIGKTVIYVKLLTLSSKVLSVIFPHFKGLCILCRPIIYNKYYKQCMDNNICKSIINK